MSQSQLMVFADVCDKLTHVWARSLRDGIMSPVGFRKDEVMKKLGSFAGTWELDLEKQDSTHSRIHVAVFLRFVEMVAAREGMKELVSEIRSCRQVTDMQRTLRFVMGYGLGSGDAWTLVANKIMAFSSLISAYHIPRGIQMLQTGDDITIDRKLRLRQTPLVKFPRVVMVQADHRFVGRPTFTSNTSINETDGIATRIRGIIKMGMMPRKKETHIALREEAKMLRRQLAVIGLPAYCEAHASLFGSQADVMEVIISRALYICSLDFHSLPAELQDNKLSPIVTIYSRDWGCFGYALAHATSSNVSAVNALATFSRPCTLSESMEACRDNNVPFVRVEDRYFGAGHRLDCAKDYIDKGFLRPVIYLFSDHALCVSPTSKTVVGLNGDTKVLVNLVNETVELYDYI